ARPGSEFLPTACGDLGSRDGPERVPIGRARRHLGVVESRWQYSNYGSLGRLRSFIHGGGRREKGYRPEPLHTRVLGPEWKGPHRFATRAGPWGSFHLEPRHYVRESGCARARLRDPTDYDFGLRPIERHPPRHGLCLDFDRLGASGSDFSHLTGHGEGRIRSVFRRTEG